jgi:transposase
MDDVTEIRRRVARGESMRTVAASLGVSRNTVRRYVAGAPPETRRAAATPRPTPKQDVVGVRLRELLTESAAWTSGKQRLTAARLHGLLRAEGYEVGLTLVRKLVAADRRQRQEVFVPLTYHPGDLCEVDFFEVRVDLPAGRCKAWMLVVRLMYSGRDFAWLFPRQDQVCFLDGLARAFAHFGGVPQRGLFDNLKSAVRRTLVGSDRLLSPRFAAFVAHHAGFEPCFARPGEGHDKGGVEARGRGIRLQELVPIPRGADLTSISAALLERLDARADHARFAEERARFLESPPVAFEPALRVDVRATRRALCQIYGAYYSVPERWAALMVTAYVGVDAIRVVGPDGEVVRRRVAFGERNVDYRDYLGALSHKPQAVRQVADVLIADLGEPFDRAWRLLVDEHGPKQAARHFARILGSVQSQGLEDTRARLDVALRAGEPILTVLWTPPRPAPALDVERVPLSLRNIHVDTPNVADFDVLLGTGSQS